MIRDAQRQSTPTRNPNTYNVTPNIHMQSETPQHILCKRGAGIIALLRKSYPPPKVCEHDKTPEFVVSFKKQSKPAPTRENNPQSVQNNMNLSITDTHNGNHVIHGIFATPTRVQSWEISQKQISNMFQVIRGLPLIIPETYPLPAG